MPYNENIDCLDIKMSKSDFYAAWRFDDHPELRESHGEIYYIDYLGNRIILDVEFASISRTEVKAACL